MPARKTAAEATTPAEDNTQAYTVLEPLLHSGTKYMPGKSIDLTTDQADAMQAKKLVGGLVKEGAE